MGLLSWGVADFLAAQAARKIGSYSVTLWAYLFGFLGTAPFALFQFIFMDTSLDFRGILIWSLACGLVSSSAYLAYYKALEKGPVSVASSAASAWLGVCVLFSIFLFGESVSFTQVILMFFILTGIILLSQSPSHEKIFGSGLAWALLAMLILGWAMAVLPRLSEAAGPFFSVLILKTMGGIGALIILKGAKISIALPQGRYLWTSIGLAGTIDAAGFIFFNLGVSFLPVVVVAPIVAAHPLATVILAVILFKERPRKIQWAGVLITLLAVIALSALFG